MKERLRVHDVARLCVSDGVPMRALGVALLIGTILNLINQGDALFYGASINWTKLILTYLVPYAVSTHGAVAVCLRKMQ
ncbi:MAG: nitrate/nitrite transporter NrtS [Alphaproteobacteria bacterium]